jgi:putative ABC transport system substrate-binding protein
MNAKLKRREFITLLGGAAAGSSLLRPYTAHSQQDKQIRRLGALMGRVESDTEGQARMAVFREQLQKLGWMEGRTIQIDIRWQMQDADSLHCRSSRP